MEYQRNVFQNILLWKKTTMYFTLSKAKLPKKIFKLTLLLVSGKKRFTFLNLHI